MADDRPGGVRGDSRFVRRTIIVIALVAAALLLWQLREVLLLLFGAIVISTVIRAVAAPFSKHLHLPETASTAASVLVIVAIVAGTLWLTGAQIAAQAARIVEVLPKAFADVDRLLATFGLGHPAQDWLARLQSGNVPLVADVGGWLSSLTQGLVGTLILLFGGIFLASTPRLYSIGVIKLVPPARRALVAEAMQQCEHALRQWLKAQLSAMIVIGVMTWIGLSLLGVQSALVLSIIAGTLEFIPYAGPILSAFPAVLVALVQGPDVALWTVLLYIVIHHLEAYLIQPIIQQYAVEVPAVVILFSLLGFAVLFGILGVILAAPLAIVGYVLVKRLYVIETLGTPTPIPGEAAD